MRQTRAEHAIHNKHIVILTWSRDHQVENERLHSSGKEEDWDRILWYKNMYALLFRVLRLKYNFYMSVALMQFLIG